LMRAPLLRLLSCSSGVGVLDDSSGEMCAAFFSFGLVGRPSDSMMPENRFSVCTPKASRIEPATILSLLLSMVENATSITKKLIIRPIRSAKVTNQPCPPACAAPRFFLGMIDVPARDPPLTPEPVRPLHGDAFPAGRPAAFHVPMSGSWNPG